MKLTGFKWVKYQSVIDDLPILGITNKQVIARHFDKMVTAGIIENTYISRWASFLVLELLKSLEY